MIANVQLRARRFSQPYLLGEFREVDEHFKSADDDNSLQNNDPTRSDRSVNIPCYVGVCLFVYWNQSDPRVLFRITRGTAF